MIGKLTPTQWVGVALLALLVVAAIAGPDAFGLDPARQSLRNVLQPPNMTYLLGTDHLGRDMAARMLAGTQLSLTLALLAVATAALLGTALGILAAWRGGWSDRLTGALADAILALPGLLLVLMLAAIAPGSWRALYIGIALTLSVEFYRYSRQRARILLAAPAVQAANLLGFGPWHVLRRHLMPELWPGLLTLIAFGIATSVTAMAALGFVGVGLRPPVAEWGLMMTQFLPYWREAPWLILQPMACLMLTVLAAHLAVGRLKQELE
jgi:peptide/nickel transport system permease protein